MNDFENITNKIMQAISSIETSNTNEKRIQLSVLLTMYHMLENEHVYEENIQALNEHQKTKKLTRRN